MAQAVTATQLTNGKGGGATTYTTSSITPSANKLIIAVVAQDRNDGTSSNAPSISGCNLTWSTVLSYHNTDTNGGQRISILRAMGSPTTGTLTISFGGQSQISGFWSVTEFDFVDTTGTGGANAVIQSAGASSTSGADLTPLTVTLSSFASSLNATIFGVISPDAYTAAPTGFSTLVTDGQDLGPDNNFGVFWKASPSTSTSIQWNGSGAEQATAIAAEIKFMDKAGGAFIYNLL